MEIVKFFQRMMQRILGRPLVYERVERSPAPSIVCAYGHAVFSGTKLCNYGHHAA